MIDVVEQLRTAIYNSKQEVTVRYDTLRDTIDLIADLIDEKVTLRREVEELEAKLSEMTDVFSD